MKNILLAGILIIFSIIGNSQEKFTHYKKSANKGLVSNCIDIIAEDNKGNLFFVAGDPYASSAWNDPNLFGYEANAYNMAGSTAQLIATGIQAASTVYGLSMFNGKVWRLYKSKKEGLADKKIHLVFKDSKGWLYFGTTKGLSLWDCEKMSLITKKNGLAGDWINEIFEDSKGNIWILTGEVHNQYGGAGGVSMFDGKKWQSWNKKNGLGTSKAALITEDKYGNIWVATGNSDNPYVKGGGVSMYNGDIWKTFTKENGLSKNKVKYIFVDKKGNLWISYVGVLYGNVLSYFDGAWHHFKAKDGAFAASWIYEDDNGNIVIYSGGRYAKYDWKSWEKIENNDTKITGYYDSKGNIWQISSKGVKKFDGSIWTEYTRKNGLIDGSIRSIYEDSKGNIWFGGRKKGISKFTP